jgi:hypothetical protein
VRGGIRFLVPWLSACPCPLPLWGG